MISRRFWRHFAGVAMLAALGACESNQSYLERLFPVAVDSIFGRDLPEPGPRFTRARLNEIPFATISVSTESGKLPETVIVPVADNNGYVTYQDNSRRSLVFYGGLLTSTNGLGYDLAAVKSDVKDPIANLIALSEWPEFIDRNYQFSLSSVKNYEITVRCTLSPVVRERIEIYELFFNVTRVQETCRNSRRTFENTYWVADRGFIWKSKQWAGPQLDPFTIEIVRPYASGT